MPKRLSDASEENISVKRVMKLVELKPQGLITDILEMMDGMSKAELKRAIFIMKTQEGFRSYVEDSDASEN